jgi:flagellum-specific ATP synthase
MADTADDSHRASARHFRRLWSTYEENRDLILMGAYAPGNDALLDEAVARNSELRSFISQAEKELVDFDESRRALVGQFQP